MGGYEMEQSLHSAFLEAIEIEANTPITVLQTQPVAWHVTDCSDCEGTLLIYTAGVMGDGFPVTVATMCRRCGRTTGDESVLFRKVGE